MRRLLIIGCGDVVRRALPRLLQRYRVYALVRQFDGALRKQGVTQIVGDLDHAATLNRVCGIADDVLHSAPPADSDQARDRRMQRLLARLRSVQRPPDRLVYISTSGVYGDCGGDYVAETRRVNPESSRAARRVSAERQLRAMGRRGRTSINILRAPGIYAADRLPLERVRRGDPVLFQAEDSYSNHVHADDLANACVRALSRGRSNRVYNVSDDSMMKMGDWFSFLADAFELPAPPRVHRAEAEQRLSPALLSFLRESRRLCNHRVKQELGLRLDYPTVQDGVAAARKPAAPEPAAAPARKPKLKKRRTETQLPLF